jgi:hypothetical protein
MSGQVGVQAPRETNKSDGSGKNVRIKVNGTVHEKSASSNLTDTINLLTLEAGMLTCTVYADGKPLDPKNSPLTFEGIKEVVIGTFETPS